ncbi:MAG: hypothetical protein ABFC67_01935 [Mizugakiibacter sp.]|uniref:hypothetical protein n=1 Tax=Mizugakiibacter sp. TaxID=1972610 RepID=UPI0031BF76F7|nr:hypothetical protein [Xanthomonadaceae bacterium]
MQRIIDLTLSVLASAAGFLLSWPFWRNFEYWPESHLAWQFYFSVGFVLAVYVFYIFIGSLRTLFQHDALEHAASAGAGSAGRPGTDEANAP